MREKKPATALNKKIDQLQAVTSGERDIYPYLRDLLTIPAFGVALRPDQIVVDSPFAGTKNAPDLTVYNTKGGKPLRNPDHAVALFEVKRGTSLDENSANELFEEKKKYIQPGTKFFFFVDQQSILRRNDLSLKLSPGSNWSVAAWDDLRDLEAFRKFFDDITPDRLSLEEQLAKFRKNETPYAYQSVNEIGRHFFIGTIRDVSELLSDAVSKLIESKVIPDIKQAYELVDKMAKRWGEPDYLWDSEESPIEFRKLTDEQSAAALEPSEVAEYQEEHDQFLSAIDPFLYALKIEKQLLQEYALRMGIDSEPSLLNPLRAKAKLTDSGRTVESFVYETASLILSRMLMVRFSEDNGFLKRYISNGGVEVFARYADYYRKPMQALLRETYSQSRDLYRNLFDRNILDWALFSTDEYLSDALLHSMFLLSRWDFRTVHGDILSGVYDHYLDVSKRRALGEVFTRPEIAQYMLDRCDYNSSKTVLDPACGTGTFLVEALSRDVRRFRDAGLLNEQTVVPTLRRLNGLDISPFSVVLAQIQILWHIIDIFTSKSPDQIRNIASSVVPAISVYGGRSSLDPLGKPLTSGLHLAGSQAGLELNTAPAVSRRKRVTIVPRKFRQISQGTYDIVVGNPPYVRSHRLVMDDATLQAYSEVVQGSCDLYIPFFYRSLVGWIKEGGRMALIAPIPILESGYSGQLRAVLEQFKIIEIVDMEALRKKTFRGVKRPTVILIVEKSVPSADDLVVLTSLFMDSYNAATDTLDFTKARRETIRRSELKQTRYLRERADLKFWALDSFGNTAESPITTKIVTNDVPVLDFFRTATRLGDIIQVAYARRGKHGRKDVASEIPEGQPPGQWEPYLMIAPGVQLGGAKAFAKQGWPIYKGQNIFPSGILGEPMGLWDPETSVTDQERILGYRTLFDNSRLYAIRNISQLPTACSVPQNVGFQNTAHMVQLTESFPLHFYLLSRIPQWYCAKLLRSNIIEDLATTWSKKQLTMIPVPGRRDSEVVNALTAAGERVVQADKDMLNADRHVEQLMKAAKPRAISGLFAEGNQVTTGLDVRCLQEGPLSIAGVHQSGPEIVGDDVLLHLVIPNKLLREHVNWVLSKVLDEDPDATISLEGFGNLLVPENLEEVVQEILRMNASDPARVFDEALDSLDQVVAKAFGLRADSIAYIQRAMKEDRFLNQLRPMYEHRGLRVQPYSDHSESDRYN